MTLSTLLGAEIIFRFQGTLLDLIEAVHLMRHGTVEEANQKLVRIDASIAGLEKEYFGRESAQHCNGVPIDVEYLRVMKGMLEYGIESPEQVMQDIMNYIKKLPAPRSSLPRSRRGV